MGASRPSCAHSWVRTLKIRVSYLRVGIGISDTFMILKRTPDFHVVMYVGNFDFISRRYKNINRCIRKRLLFVSLAVAIVLVLKYINIGVSELRGAHSLALI